MIRPENIMRVLPGATPPSRARLEAYFAATASECLRYLGRRPLTLVRNVEGVCFFHKGPLPPIPDNVHQMTIEKRDGSAGHRLWVDDFAGLIALLDLDTVEIHPWNCVVADVERADQLVFDLDPDERVEWSTVCAAALELRAHLERAGLPVWAKTTGGRGLHTVVPLPTPMLWDDARAVSREIAESFVRRDPARFTAERGALARRGGKIFIDWLRNGRGASAIGAMSPRARAGGLVSAPLSWAEVAQCVPPEQFTLEAVRRRPAPENDAVSPR